MVIRAGEGLSRAERLHRRPDFERVYRRGRRVRLPGITVAMARNSLSYSRLGISVGKRFGKAAKRNRAKRILRELFRRHKVLFPAGHDIVLIPGGDFPWDDWQRLQSQVLEGLHGMHGV